MIEVIGVSFDGSNKIYYFLPNNLELKKGDLVIVETERGKQFGKIVTNKINIKRQQLVAALKEVLALATEEDIKKQAENSKEAEKAVIDAKKFIDELGLNMKILGANFTFDKKQLLFNFVADERVDFRVLAKKLAAVYRTRIELRQIGVRDKAKEVGGIGQCGRELCCSLFLKDLNTVSINMAKNQNLALNPQKINGSCGRLMCCLNYENETYADSKKYMPKINDIVATKKGKGRVVSIDILNQSYQVNVDNEIIEVVEEGI